MKMRVFTPEEQRKICEEYQGGKPLRRLAKELSCGKETLKQFLTTEGIQLRESNHWKKLAFVCEECDKEFERRVVEGTIPVAIFCSRICANTHRNKAGARAFTEQELAVIRDECRSTLTLGQVAEKHGCCVSTLRKCLVANSIETKPPGWSNKRANLSAEEQKQICESYQQGAGIVELASKHHRWAKTITRCLEANGIAQRDHWSKYDYKLDVFHEKGALAWYLFGAFITDGSVMFHGENKKSATVRLTSKDKDWLEAIASMICPGKGLTTILREDRAAYYEVGIHSGKLAEWLVARGCVPNKSLTVKFPEVPKDFLPDFIRGCWDGDGSLSFRRRKNENGKITNGLKACSFVSASYCFKNGMRKALSSLGIETVLVVREEETRTIRGRSFTSTNKLYRLDPRTWDDVCTFLKTVYYPGHRLSLPRKNKLAQEMIAYWDREFRCLECDVAIVPTDNHGRGSLKYCRPCAMTRTQASQKRSGERRKLANAA